MKDETIFTFNIWDSCIYEELKEGKYKDGYGNCYQPKGVIKVCADNIKEAEVLGLQKAKETLLSDNVGITFKEVDIVS